MIENGNELARAKNMCCKKFQSVGFKDNKLLQDPYHIVHDYEPYNFSDLDERNLSFRSLIYPILRLKFDYGNHSTSFKLLSCCVLIL